MATPFPRNVRYVQTGDPVSAGVVNNPLESLVRRTDSLRERMDSALLGAALVDLDVAIESSAVLPGMAVYRDAAGVYRPALATVEEANNVLQLADSGYPWGLVALKSTNTLGHVVLTGLIQLTLAQVEAITDSGEVELGLLFISATPGNAGKLTSSQPPIGVPVCMLTGPVGTNDDGDELYSLMVAPGWRNPFENHIHYAARLATDTTNGSSNPEWQAIAAWELATGLEAPAGAVYRYTHERQDDLSAIWPPVPIGAVHFDIDGISSDLLNGVPVLVNDLGIFWTSGSDNPDDFDRHDLYFLRMTFKNNTSVVTRLRPLDASVTIENEDGDPAEVGELYIGVNVDIDNTSSNAYGQAVKDLSGLTGEIGPVVDGVRSGTPSTLSAVGTGSFVYEGYTYQKGPTTLTVLPSDSRERGVSSIELDNVQVQTSDPVTYLALPSTGGSLVGRIEVPEIGIDTQLDVTLVVELWARAAGNMPDLTVEAVVVSPLTTTPAVVNPSLASVGTLDLPSGVSNNHAFRRTIELAAAVEPGSIVYFSLARAGSDGYSGDVGVLALKWYVEAT